MAFRGTHHQVRRAADAIMKASAAPTPSLPTFRMVWATVISIQTGPPKTLTLQIQGSSTSIAGIRYSSEYTPTVNDTIYGWWNGSDLTMQGKLA